MCLLTILTVWNDGVVCGLFHCFITSLHRKSITLNGNVKSSLSTRRGLVFWFATEKMTFNN